MSARNLGHPMVDIMKRFHPSGSAEQNAAIENDPRVFESDVTEETKESVNYARVPFNMPHRSMPIANYFGIQGMAEEVLDKSGHRLEGQMLRSVYRLLRVGYSEMNNRLFHFLDFAPLPAPSPEHLAELKALQERMGLDDTVMVPRKKTFTNPLDHKAGTPAQEWDWLVANTQTVNAYGKDAVSHLSTGAMHALMEKWFTEIRLHGPAPIGDPEDPSFGNRAWFNKNFPMGFSRLDHFHDTPLTSVPMSFGLSTQLCLYEEIDKTHRGWSSKDVRFMGYGHMNTVGLSGFALLSLEADAHLENKLLPELAIGKGAPGSSAFCAYIESLNPTMGSHSEAFWSWATYCKLNPEISEMVRESVFARAQSEAQKNGPNSKNTGNARAQAEYERLSLAVTLGLQVCSQVAVAPDPTLREALVEQSKRVAPRL